MEDSIQSYKIASLEGMGVGILNFGATIRSIYIPSQNGKINVALGYGDINQYKEGSFFIGATVGRFANRIAGGQFKIDGKKFQLPINNGENHLHGGPVGFAKRYWNLVSHTENTLVLGLASEDGDQGYPGNLSIQAEFKLETGMRLSVQYRATTDSATPVNLASHVYFNLNGTGENGCHGSLVNNHEIQLNADSFTPVDHTMIPTGEIAAVANTAFDFRKPVILHERLNSEDYQLEPGNGFDHNFVLNGYVKESRFIGRVRSPSSGIQMNLYSNQSGVQFYTGNYLDSTFLPYSGLCLETQSFPDAPNKPQFPNAILKEGETYLANTTFEFECISQDA